MRAAAILLFVTVAVADDFGIEKAREAAKAGPEAARAVVPHLIALGKGTAEERFAARDALAVAGPPALVKLIGEAGGNPSLRLLLEGVSHDLGAGTVVAALPALSHKEPKVRAMAAVALGAAGKGGEAAVKHLDGALHDPDADVRREAALALGGIGRGAHEAISGLLYLANDPERKCQREALLALGMILRDAAERERPAPEVKPEVAGAIESGLKWLAAHQEPDGRWDGAHFDHDGKCGGAGAEGREVELTSLALLAFLESGAAERYAGTVGPAWRYLASVLAGDSLPGSGDARAVAAASLCAAARVLDEPGCRNTAERALAALVPAGTAWEAVAAIEGIVAGLRPEERRLVKNRIEIADLDRPDRERTPLRPPRNVLSYLLWDAQLRTTFASGFPEAIKQCDTSLPRWDNEGTGVEPEVWVLTALAMHYAGRDDVARRCSDALKAAVLAHQQPAGAGCRAGSWDPVGPTAAEGGRVHATAAFVLSLGGAAGVPRPRELPLPDAPQFKAAVATLKVAVRSEDEAIRAAAEQALAGFAR